ncbi:UNVERIFIED_CONTAM: hypothetical protein FKN15_053475 [Acipenser sinensis]
MDRNALAELLQALESRRDAEERRREERYTALIERVGLAVAAATTPTTTPDEKALLEELISFLSGTDESELAEIDRALGIDKLVQGGGLDPLQERFPPQPPQLDPMLLDSKPPGYPPQFPPGLQQPQRPGFRALQGGFPGVVGIGLRPGMAIAPSVPNQLRLQLQQRLQGPQQENSELFLFNWDSDSEEEFEGFVEEDLAKVFFVEVEEEIERGAGSEEVLTERENVSGATGRGAKRRGVRKVTTY